jgi:hypothetical protein
LPQAKRETEIDEEVDEDPARGSRSSPTERDVSIDRSGALGRDLEEAKHDLKVRLPSRLVCKRCDGLVHKKQRGRC